MNQNWKSDPNLKKMDQQKMDFFHAYAEKLSNTPKDRMMTVFLSMQNEARQKNIRFTDQETDYIMKILSSHMSPEEQKRMESITALAKKLAVRS